MTHGLQGKKVKFIENYKNVSINYSPASIAMAHGPWVATASFNLDSFPDSMSTNPISEAPFHLRKKL